VLANVTAIFMKELLQQLTTYNAWANGLLLECIGQLPEEKLTATLPSSFGSLQGTLLHMWDAESIWWQRMKLQERIVIPSEGFEGAIKEVTTGLQGQDRQWTEWVMAAQEHMFQHEFLYYNSRKERFKQPVYHILLHLANHNTYHRGQLVNMLRQLGVEKIPTTDFVVWSRKK
jgi:uncharacterized damage-inducible protein DinB